MKQARALRIILPALFFLAWASLFTYPLILHLSDSVILTAGGDAWLHLWDLWWADKSLVGLHQNPYFTNYLYYPTGLNLFYHSLDIVNGIVSIPVQHLLGLTTSFNLLLILNLAGDGLAAYWLCLERTHSTGAAIVGGALFAAAPLMSTSVNLGQLDEVTAWWLPLYIIALWRALDSPGAPWLRGGGWRAVFCAGLCLAGASLATWYFTAGLIIFTVIHVPAYLLSRENRTIPPRALWLSSAAKAIAVLAIFVVVLGPLLLAMVRERLSGATYMLPSFATTLANSADIAGVFLPSRLALESVSSNGSNYSLGAVATLLGLVGLVRQWRVAWPLGLALLGITIMSLGPHLQLLGTDTGIPMPYTLLDNVPFLGASRQPLRFIATSGICLSLLAAYGVAALQRAARYPAMLKAAVPLLLVLAVVELFGIPRLLTSTAIDPAYTVVRDAKAPGGVMELPYELWQTRPQYYQSLHEHPILGGYTSRHFPYPFIEGAPGASQLAAGYPETLDAPDIISPTIKQTALASLDYYGVRYVVLHKPDLASGRFGRLAGLVHEIYPQGSTFENDAIAIYQTPAQNGGEGESGSLPLVGLGRGWHEVEENPTRRWTGSDPGNGDAYVWIGIRPEAAGGPYSLTMQAFSYANPRHLSIVFSGRTLLKEELGLAPTTISVDLGNLAPGDYSLLLKVDEPPTMPPGNGDRRLLSMGVTSLEVSATR